MAQFTKQLDRGARGDDVLALQKFLVAQGAMTQADLDTGPSIFGPRTQRAVQAFQKKQGIVSAGTPTSTGYGRIGPQTLSAMNKLYSSSGRKYKGIDVGNVSFTQLQDGRTRASVYDTNGKLRISTVSEQSVKELQGFNKQSKAPQSIPYKFYKGLVNGRWETQISPGTNTPRGMKEIGLDEFKKLASQSFKWKETTDQYGVRKKVKDSTLQQYERDPKYKELLAGKTVSSGIIKNTGQFKDLEKYTGSLGTFVSEGAINKARTLKQQAEGGQMKEIAGGMFVPTGSPAAQSPEEQEKLSKLADIRRRIEGVKTGIAEVKGKITPDTKGIQDIQAKRDQMDVEGNAEQEKERDTISAEFGKNVDVSKSEAMRNRLLKTLEEKKEAPEAPSLADQFETKRQELGIEPLETEMADLDSQVEEIQANLLVEAEKAGERLVPMAQIGRKRGKLQKEAEQRIALLNVERSAVARRLDNKISTLNTIMRLTNQDFANASTQYNQEFNKNIQMINLLGKAEDQEQNEAQANLNSIINLAGKSGKTWNDLDADMQRQINNLELQYGLPQGTYESFMINKPDAEVLSTTKGTDAQGNDITTFIYKDPNTGKAGTVEVVKTGGVEDIKDEPSVADMSVKDLKTYIKEKFDTKFANEIILELNNEQLREFMRDYDNAQNKFQISLEPEAFLKEWKALAGIDEKKKGEKREI